MACRVWFQHMISARSDAASVRLEKEKVSKKRGLVWTQPELGFSFKKKKRKQKDEARLSCEFPSESSDLLSPYF